MRRQGQDEFFPADGAFQSTHPRGVRRARQIGRVDVARVSIHAPAWGATSGGQTGQDPLYWFQSTHPRGVRLAFRAYNYIANEFQSTHPRGVRRYVPYRLLWDDWVSIHAPAWGATELFRLTWGDVELFQSTHPRGVRRAGYKRHYHTSRVSIHAPAWGATSKEISNVIFKSEFQSTHPRGVRQRPPGNCPSSGGTSFNPRTRVGCDCPAARSWIHGERVSIHAPAWGATPDSDAASGL